MHVRVFVVALLAAAVAVPAAPVRADEPTISSQVIESFDGTRINTTLFLPPGASASNRVPVIFRTHGWGGSGETSVGTGTLRKLLDDGYAVLTWDQRGFGRSGGEAQVDAPEFERRDVQALIDWVAQRPEILLEAPGDPVLGFTGASYAGGIQLVTAAFDERVDAIAPEIPWFDLRYSLFPNGVIKTAWDQVLYGAGLATATLGGVPVFETGAYARELHQAEAEGVAFDRISPELLDWYAERSLVGYGQRARVDVPTLVMEGSVDTLFNINEGVAIWEHVRASGAPAKLIVFCGSLVNRGGGSNAVTHGICPDTYERAGDREHLDAAILAWFRRYLRGDAGVDTGAPVEYRTNEGRWRSLPTWPAPDATTLTGTAEGTVVSTPPPTSGHEAIAASPAPANDPGTLTAELAAAADGPLEIVGIPTATLRVSGTGPGVHLFVKLVDREAGHVLNNQETPWRVENLSAEAQTFELDLTGVAYTLPEGHHLDLQVSTTSAQFSAYRGAAQATVGIDVAVPVRNAAVGGAGTGDGPPAQGAPAPAAPPAGRSLPATGAGWLPGLGLAVVAAAGVLRRVARSA